MVEPATTPPEAGAVPGQTDPATEQTGRTPAPAEPTPTSGPLGRALKLVVTLHPGESGHRALLALGADGCDPVFRSCAVDGLLAALDQVSALLAEAEARWREQPRNPTSARTRPTGRRDAPVSGGPSSAETAAPAGQSPALAAARPTAAPPARPAPTGQLTLFG
jgi:hypothetical protein